MIGIQHFFRIFGALCVTLLLLIPRQGDAKEFLNTFMHINLGVSYSLASVGDIMDREKDLTLDTAKSSTFDYEKPTFSHIGLNLAIDLVPFDPLVFYHSSQAMKIGLRGGFRYNSFGEKLSVTDNGNTKSYSDTLMS